MGKGLKQFWKTGQHQWLISCIIAVAAIIAIAVFLITRAPVEDPQMPQTAATPLLESQEILNQKDVKITAKSLTLANDTTGAILRILVENDTEYPIEIDDPVLSAVNNIMISSTLDCTIDPGKKLHKDIIFDYNELTTAGIQDIKNIEFSLNIYSVKNEGSAKELLYASSPIALRTTIDPDFVQDLVNTAEPFINQDGFSVSIRAYDSARNTAYVMIQNQTPNNITVSLKNISLNSERMSDASGIFSTDIGAGNTAYAAIPLGKYDSTVKSVSMSFDVLNFKDRTPILSTEMGHFTPAN